MVRMHNEYGHDRVDGATLVAGDDEDDRSGDASVGIHGLPPIPLPLHRFILVCSRRGGLDSVHLVEHELLLPLSYSTTRPAF